MVHNRQNADGRGGNACIYLEFAWHVWEGSEHEVDSLQHKCFSIECLCIVIYNTSAFVGVCKIRVLFENENFLMFILFSADYHYLGCSLLTMGGESLSEMEEKEN